MTFGSRLDPLRDRLAAALRAAPDGDPTLIADAVIASLVTGTHLG